MELAQAITDKDKIEMVKNELLKEGYKYYLMFVIGINTGLRIGELLELKVSSIKEGSYIYIRSKKRRLFINPKLKDEIDRFVGGMGLNDYLFQSRNGNNKPITRVQAYRILNSAGKKVGLQEIGTQTLRRTFGYWHYKQYRNVTLLQDLLGHAERSMTLRYIGINDDIKDNNIEDFYL